MTSTLRRSNPAVNSARCSLVSSECLSSPRRVPPLGAPKIFDCNIAALEPARLRGDPFARSSTSALSQETYDRRLSLLLRAPCERPCLRVTKECDEIAPPHSSGSLLVKLGNAGRILPSILIAWGR